MKSRMPTRRLVSIMRTLFACLLILGTCAALRNPFDGRHFSLQSAGHARFANRRTVCTKRTANHGA
jgi:hypothetical protein